MDSSSKFFFSFSVNYVMIVKLVDLIVLLGSKLLNRFRKFSTIRKKKKKKMNIVLVRKRKKRKKKKIMKKKMYF